MEEYVDPFDNSDYNGYSTFYDNSDFGDDSINENNNGTSTGGNNNGEGSSSGGGGSNSSTSPSCVLPKSSFRGYKDSDPNGCLRRCEEMLATVNCHLNGQEILMCESTTDGRPQSVADSAANGIAYIEECLTNRHPVVVCVDYQPGHTTGNSRADQAGDHFLVIVGGNRRQGFRYYDPGRRTVADGTNINNMFYSSPSGRWIAIKHNSTNKYYTITSIRKLR